MSTRRAAARTRRHPMTARALSASSPPAAIALSGSSRASAATDAPREAAYRANNVGVALPRAVRLRRPRSRRSSRRFEQDPTLALARLNLAIALFYAGSADAAATRARAARGGLPGSPAAALRARPDRARGEPPGRGACRRSSACAALDPDRSWRADQPRADSSAGAALRRSRRRVPRRARRRALQRDGRLQPRPRADSRAATADEGETAMERFEQLRDERLRHDVLARPISSRAATPRRSPPPARSRSSSTRARRTSTFVRRDDGDRAGQRRGARPATAAAGRRLCRPRRRRRSRPRRGRRRTALRLYRNDRGRFADVTASALRLAVAAQAGSSPATATTTATPISSSSRAGRPGAVPPATGGRFVCGLATAGLPRMHGVATGGASLDVDHDGDLDRDRRLDARSADGRPAPEQRRRPFTDVTRGRGMVGRGRRALPSVPTDFDNRRDVDLFWSRRAGPPLLFRNLRDGTFRDVARERGLRPRADFTCARRRRRQQGRLPRLLPRRGATAAGRLAAERRPRALRRDARRPAGTAGALARSSSTTTTTGCSTCWSVADRRPASAAQRRERAGPTSPVALRERGAGRVGTRRPARSRPAISTATATPIVVSAADGRGLRVLAQRRRQPRTIAARPARRRASATAAGVGAKIEMRAGSLQPEARDLRGHAGAARRRRRSSGSGSRAGADVVRVLWPSGILQAETAATDAARRVARPAARRAEDRGARSQAVVVPVPLHVERRAVRVRDRLPGRRRDGLLAGARRSATPRSRRVRAHRRATSSGRETAATSCASPTSWRKRSSSTALQLLAVAHPGRRRRSIPNEGLRSTPEPFQPVRRAGRGRRRRGRDEHGHDVLRARRRASIACIRTTSRCARDPRLRGGARADARSAGLRRRQRTPRPAADRLDRLRLLERQRRRAPARAAHDPAGAAGRGRRRRVADGQSPTSAFPSAGRRRVVVDLTGTVSASARESGS